MKAASFYALTLTSILGVAAIESLSEYVGDVPKCAYSAFTESVEKEGCNTKDVNASTFDCICKHMASIVITVVREVDSNCNASKSITSFLFDFPLRSEMPRTLTWCLVLDSSSLENA